jgi:hypothetical protein
MPDTRLQEDQIEIRRLMIDFPEGEDPELADQIARQLIERLHRLLEEL